MLSPPLHRRVDTSRLLEARVPLVLSLAVLLTSRQFAVADSRPPSCKPCYNDGCPGQKICVQECLQACPEGYYRSGQSGSFVCQTERQTTTTTTTSTPTTTTTSPPTTTTADETTATSLTDSSSPPLAIVRRQAAEDNSTSSNNGTSEQTTTAPTTSPTTTLPTTTAPTTTELPTLVCKLCNITSCRTCEDNAENSSVCVGCKEGYHPSNDQTTCMEDDDELAPGAIAGIVIGVVVFVVAVVLLAVYVAMKYRRDREVILREDEVDRSIDRPLAHVVPPIPKIKPEDVQRNHDRVTRYTRDPTQTNTSETPKLEEQRELDNLGTPPPPPLHDGNKRYDSLRAAHRDEPQSYSPLTSQNNPSPYVNIGKAGEDHKPKQYANTQSTPPSKVSQSHPAHKKATTMTVQPVPEEPDEIYEPVERKIFSEEAQGIYANTESITLSQMSHAEAENIQQVYANDTLDNIDEVYENA